MKADEIRRGEPDPKPPLDDDNLDDSYDCEEDDWDEEDSLDSNPPQLIYRDEEITVKYHDNEHGIPYPDMPAIPYYEAIVMIDEEPVSLVMDTYRDAMMEKMVKDSIPTPVPTTANVMALPKGREIFIEKARKQHAWDNLHPTETRECYENPVPVLGPIANFFKGLFG